jgi:hypothetical protein
MAVISMFYGIIVSIYSILASITCLTFTSSIKTKK